MRTALAIAIALLLAGCPLTRPEPPAAQCNPICFLPCTSDGDPGVRWEADPNSSEAWDALAGEVVPALTEKANTCELRRKACDQCLRRLDDAGAIELGQSSWGNRAGAMTMASTVKLVTRRDEHQQEVVDRLRTLLADAEAGEIVAFCGVAEYKTEYRTIKSGMRNVYSMAGALFVAAQECAK